MKDKEIGFMKKLLLKALTFLQEATLKQSNDEFYYLFTKMHFRLYFGKSLVEEAEEYSRDFRRAKRRHSGMVITLLYPDHANKKGLSSMIEESFTKNLLLESKLN